MKLGLDGKIVLITGGSKGIGLACARAFAAEGARVAIASRSQENLERARQTLAGEGVDVVTQVADFSRPQDAQAAASQTEKLLGPVDVLINCAGAANRYQIDAYDTEAWHQGLDSSLEPSSLWTEAQLPSCDFRIPALQVNHEGLDDVGIELSAGTSAKFFGGFFRGGSFAVRSVAGDGVEAVGHSDDARTQRDLISA